MEQNEEKITLEKDHSVEYVRFVGGAGGGVDDL